MSDANAVKARIAALQVKARIDAIKARSSPGKAKPGIVIDLTKQQIDKVKAGGVNQLVLTVAQLDSVHSQQGNLLMMSYGPDGHLRYPLT